MPRARRAVEVVADTVSALCPCGGNAMDDRNGSFMLTSDSINIKCDTCGVRLTLPRSAPLFAAPLR